jgi:hypothetical protein
MLAALVACLGATTLLMGVPACASSPGRAVRHGTRHAPPAAAAPEVAGGTRAGRWLAGPAGRLLTAVDADLGRLSTARQAGQLATARLAGMRLSADARAALLGPAPPLAARLYRLALTELGRAGRRTAAGRFRAANLGLRAGQINLTRAVAAANSPAAEGYPAPPLPR